MVGFFLPFCIGLALAAVTTVTITLAFTFMSFCMVSAAFGFFWATFGALQPQVTRYVVGQEQLACAFGYLLVFVATGSILGAPTAGRFPFVSSSITNWNVTKWNVAWIKDKYNPS